MQMGRPMLSMCKVPRTRLEAAIEQRFQFRQFRHGLVFAASFQAFRPFCSCGPSHVYIWANIPLELRRIVRNQATWLTGKSIGCAFTLSGLDAFRNRRWLGLPGK